MADRLAGRIRRSRNASLEDLRQSARLGPVTAVNRYDPGRGDSFLPYAVACVLGELKRHLRDTTWRVAAPRGTKELALRVCQAADALSGYLGRSPTVPRAGYPRAPGLEDQGCWSRSRTTVPAMRS
jgi:RNA polymerase sigma-B factor